MTQTNQIIPKLDQADKFELDYELTNLNLLEKSSISRME